MCNPDTTPFDQTFADLEDKDLWDRSASDDISQAELDTEADAVTRATSGGHITSQADVGRYPCRGCKGRGYINIYRRGGGWGQTPDRRQCWKGCGGTGYTKTPPTVLEKRRERNADRRRLRAAKHSDAAKRFLDSRPEIRAWFQRQEDRGNQFGMDLQAKLFQYGNLTPGQLACIERDIEKYNAILAERQGQQPPKGTGLDLRGLPGGTYAVPGGDTRLKVRVDVVTKGRWAGWVFVKDGAQYGRGRRYGAQRPGEEYVGDIVEELRVILQDPRAAMAAYGQLVGRCGVCNRKLEDEESIALGIGPVCARKFG